MTIVDAVTSHSIHHAIRAFRANSKQNWCGCTATLKEGGAVEMAHMGLGVSALAERAAINREEDIYNEIKERHLGLDLDFLIDLEYLLHFAFTATSI